MITRMIDEFKNIGFNFAQVLVYGVIALLSGVMKGLHKVQDIGFKFTVFVANAAVSSFVGIIFFFILAGLELPTYFCAALTGIAGWMGGNFMDFLGLWLKKSVTRATKTDITVEEEKNHSELINQQMYKK